MRTRTILLALAAVCVADRALAVVYVDAVKNDSPLAYWRLDETTGPTIFDLTSNNHDGTISGAVNLGMPGATGDGNAAAEFAGGSVAFPSVDGLQDNFSVEFWLNPETRTNYNQGLGGDGGWGQYYFHTGNNGPVWTGPTCCGGARRFESGDLPNNTVQLGTWQHFVFTFEDLNATQGTATFYKNGTPLVQRALLKGAPWTAFNLSGGLDGLVDEVAIYDYALTGDQVAAHFASAANVPEPATWALLLAGGLVLAAAGRRGRRAPRG